LLETIREFGLEQLALPGVASARRTSLARPAPVGMSVCRVAQGSGLARSTTAWRCVAGGRRAAHRTVAAPRSRPAADWGPGAAMLAPRALLPVISHVRRFGGVPGSHEHACAPPDGPTAGLCPHLLAGVPTASPSASRRLTPVTGAGGRSAAR
jgi:hypothetical protein